jgi:protein tyrosine phosphatase
MFLNTRIYIKMSLTPPTPNCNYLLDERIMFGWYPGPDNNGQCSNSIHDILATGRTVFVNLTSYNEITSLYNYGPSVLTTVRNPIFIYHQMDDGTSPSNSSDIISYKALIKHLHHLVEQNYKIYIHCRGGHGRSGIVAACLLIHMGYSNEEALEMVSAAHKTRAYIPDYPCPQTPEQVQFVKNYTL